MSDKNRPAKPLPIDHPSHPWVMFDTSKFKEASAMLTVALRDFAETPEEAEIAAQLVGWLQSPGFVDHLMTQRTIHAMRLSCAHEPSVPITPAEEHHQAIMKARQP